MMPMPSSGQSCGIVVSLVMTMPSTAFRVPIELMLKPLMLVPRIAAAVLVASMMNPETSLPCDRVMTSVPGFALLESSGRAPAV